MIQIAQECEDDEYGLTQMVESVSVMLLDTFREAGTKALKRQLQTVESLRPDGYESPKFIGCNRQLPISQNIVSFKAVEQNIDCRRCNLSILLDDYAQHLQTQHEDFDLPLECTKCGKGFEIGDPRFANHVRLCQLRPCTDCDKAFSSTQALNDHFLWEHTDERPHTCESCGQVFHAARNLSTHEAIHVPLNARPLKCSHCPERFANRDALLRHENKHRRKNNSQYTCNRCGLRTRNESELAAHQKALDNCENYILRSYRTGEKQSSGSGNKNERFLYCCPFYPGCEWSGPTPRSTHRHQHGQCRHCHMMFPYQAGQGVGWPKKQMRDANKTINNLVAAHERICPFRTTPKQRPGLFTEFVRATDENVGIKILASIRKYFVGTAEYEARFPGLMTAKNLDKPALDTTEAGEGVDQLAVSSATKKPEVAAKNREDDSVRKALAPISTNEAEKPPKKKFKSMKDWFSVT